MCEKIYKSDARRDKAEYLCINLNPDYPERNHEPREGLTAVSLSRAK